jgi:hypothetical protein
MVCAPLVGWSYVDVSDRHTRVDWAHVMRKIVDEFFPTAAGIDVVRDNLNMKTPHRSPRESRRQRPSASSIGGCVRRAWEAAAIELD